MCRGLCTPKLATTRLKTSDVVAAFDIDENKVGKDLSEAIFTKPNNTLKFADVPVMGVPVDRGMTHGQHRQIRGPAG